MHMIRALVLRIDEGDGFPVWTVLSDPFDGNRIIGWTFDAGPPRAWSGDEADQLQRFQEWCSSRMDRPVALEAIVRLPLFPGSDPSRWADQAFRSAAPGTYQCDLEMYRVLPPADPAGHGTGSAA